MNIKYKIWQREDENEEIAIRESLTRNKVYLEIFFRQTNCDKIRCYKKIMVIESEIVESTRSFQDNT